MKDTKYMGFTIRFKVVRKPKFGYIKGKRTLLFVNQRVDAYFKSGPKKVGSIDTTRIIGSGETKRDALDGAKRLIELELESFYEPRWGSW